MSDPGILYFLAGLILFVLAVLGTKDAVNRRIPRDWWEAPDE